MVLLNRGKYEKGIDTVKFWPFDGRNCCRTGIQGKYPVCGRQKRRFEII
jgi:hypothetical protein